jgi:hypothetical protein
VEIVKTRPTQSCYVVYKFDDIVNKILPFFDTYPLKGNKLLDLYYFKKIANITEKIDKYNEKSDLLKEIIRIKKYMNRNR